jgi:hypothetical protein
VSDDIERYRRQRDQLREAIRHVVDDSPGTPGSVKTFLSRAVLETSDDAPRRKLRATGDESIEVVNSGAENWIQPQPDPWPIIEWLAENMPRALELCPYKVKRA